MRISDVAEALGVSTSTLKRFLVLHAPEFLKKTPGGFYRFCEKDIQAIDHFMHRTGERRQPAFNIHRRKGSW